MDLKWFTFFASEYKDQFYYWEILKLNLKLAIMGFLVIFENDILNKIIFIFFFISLYCAALYKYQPYKIPEFNGLDVKASIMLIISIYLGFLLYVNYSLLPIRIILLIFLVITNLGFLLWAALQLFYAHVPII